MQQRTEAEQYLLEEIRRGSGPAWSQLVERYQGRLLAFARSRVPKGTEPDDLVQDTFLQFLRGLANFREEASLETYLFVILRRRLADIYRAGGITAPGSSTEPFDSAPAPDHTASWYMRRDEQRGIAQSALGTALQSLLSRMQENLNFRDLQIVELIFHAHWPNRRIADELAIDADQVALLKHRWLKQLHERVTHLLEERADEAADSRPNTESLDSLLTEIWTDQRPSCPKRSTIGGFVLGTLDDAWQKYIDFHINRLECSFCRANLEDLQSQSRQDPLPLRHRIMESTVGFFRRD